MHTKQILRGQNVGFFNVKIIGTYTDHFIRVICKVS